MVPKKPETPRVQILNVPTYTLEEAKDLPPKHAIICITQNADSPSLRHLSAPTLRVEFDNIEAPGQNALGPLNPLSPEKARRLIEFADHWAALGMETLVISCPGGAMRSASVALGLHAARGWKLPQNFWDLNTPLALTAWTVFQNAQAAQSIEETAPSKSSRAEFESWKALFPPRRLPANAEEITQAINDLLATSWKGENPEDINQGNCECFAAEVVNLLKFRGRQAHMAWVPEMAHCAIPLNGNWHDAECPPGAPATMLPIARRMHQTGLKLLQETCDRLAKEHFPLDRRGVHGPRHWNQVAVNAQRICRMKRLNPLSGAAFGWLHDIARQDEHEDPEHGPRAADLVENDPKAMELLRTILGKDLDKVLTAIRIHTEAQNHEDPLIGACLDADRLDLGRVGIRPNPKFFSTPEGIQILKDQ
jgi:uncharacterized protein